MHIYIFLIFIILILFYFIKDKSKALKISFLLLTIVASIRKNTVGVDTLQFFNAFNRIGISNSWNYKNFRYELGFFYLCKILYIIFKKPQSLIFISSIFINFSVYKFFKENSSNYSISTILYVIMNIFFSYMNIMREAIAIGILLFGFDYIKDKKYIKFLIIVVIASLFHKAAIAILFLMVFSILPNKKISYFIEVCMALCTFLLYYRFFNILASILGYSDYARGSYGVSNYFAAVLKFLESLVTMVSLYFISYTGRNKFLNNKMRILTISTIIYIWFQLLSIRMIIFNRIYGLYSIYLLITIPELLMIIKKDNYTNYIIMKFFVITLYLLSFLIIGKFRPEWFGTIPYRFFWQ